MSEVESEQSDINKKSELNNSFRGLKKDTEVILYIGDAKKVQDIEVGEYIMGDDNTVRKVTKVFHNTISELYKITPDTHSKNSQSYVVTSNYVLCFRYNTGPRVKKKHNTYYVEYAEQNFDNQSKLAKVKIKNQPFKSKLEAENYVKLHVSEYRENYPIHEVEVENYFKLAKSFRHRLVGYRSGLIRFPLNFWLDIDPYLVGLWLGDGTSARTQITNIDPEVIEYIYKIAEKLELHVINGRDTEHHKGSYNYTFTKLDGKRNCFMEFLKENNLINNKHIPLIYKQTTIENRKQLLAGLIDTDGYLAKDRYYEIIQKNKILADDIVFVSRSLGYHVSQNKCTKGCMYKGKKSEGTYYRMNICSTEEVFVSDIPVKIKRKILTNEIKHRVNSSNYKIKIEKQDDAESFGFEFEGNNSRFLLGDFSISHDCS